MLSKRLGDAFFIESAIRLWASSSNSLQFFLKYIFYLNGWSNLTRLKILKYGKNVIFIEIFWIWFFKSINFSKEKRNSQILALKLDFFLLNNVFILKKINKVWKRPRSCLLISKKKIFEYLFKINTLCFRFANNSTYYKNRIVNKINK